LDSRIRAVEDLASGPQGLGSDLSSERRAWFARSSATLLAAALGVRRGSSRGDDISAESPPPPPQVSSSDASESRPITGPAVG